MDFLVLVRSVPLKRKSEWQFYDFENIKSTGLLSLQTVRTQIKKHGNPNLHDNRADNITPHRRQNPHENIC